jgi:predicted nucleic acid-binding protein
LSSRRPHRASGPKSRPGRVFVDSGAWLALFSATDGKHAVADSLFRQSLRDSIPLLTTNLVLAEVHRLLLFRAGQRAAATALARVDDSSLVDVHFTSGMIHDAARGWLARLSDQKISYTDASSFAVMEAAKCRVAMTFDRDFWIAGFEVWGA